MRIILIIAVIIAAFSLLAILTIIKDQLEEYKKIRDEDNQRKQYWSKVDYYKKRMKHPFCEGLAPVNIDGKYGYINEYYDVVIQPQYDDAGSFYNGTALVEKGGMECVIDKTGKIIIIAFDKIYGFGDDNRVRSGNKWGYVDKEERRIFKPQFDDIHTFSESLAGIRIGDKWGFIDRSGKIVISPQFDDVGGFCEGLCSVKISKKWGFIDRSGKIIINPQFNKALYFSENLCGVKIGKRWGFIDRLGKRIIKPQFEETSEFRKSFASVKINNKWGVINASGNYVIDPVLDENPDLADLSEGYGIVKKDQVYWYINKKGKMIRFEDAERWWFKEDLAAVKLNGLWGYIDKMGSFVINPQFTKAFSFDYGGFAIVEKDNMLMLINKKGETVVRACDFSCYCNSRYYNYQYRMFMFDFHEGLSRIILRRDEPEMKKGMLVSYSDVVYMDNKGKIAIRPDCYDCGDFSEGLAPVCEFLHGDFGYINKSGKYIIEPAFEYACSFSEGLAKIVKDKKSGGRYTYINKAGEEVIKTKFWDANDFSGGMALVSIKVKDDVIKYGFINKQGYSAFEL